ncbi:MAG: GNAT family N-acetyltransferase [Alphaproteobacteria bacterium]|jgi:RimJ/RimL family protein N-acetyltransferase|nr:GNAT family N-acetyltransferase [Alphaproteobacteria bacterium]
MSEYKAEKYRLKDGREIILRSPKPEDLPKFREFIKVIGEETTFTNQTPLRPEAPDEKILQVWKQHNEAEISSIIIAIEEKTENIVGLIGLTQVSPLHPWLEHISNFATMIVKDYWGVGLGSKFMSEIIAHCEKSGIKRLEGSVRTYNEKAIRLYKKYGFEIEGCQKNTALIDGNMTDLYMIAKFFNL